MPKKCELTGKRPLKGHKVSHANNKVKRRFLPSVKKVSFKSELLNKRLKGFFIIFLLCIKKTLVIFSKFFGFLKFENFSLGLKNNRLLSTFGLG